MDPAQSDEAVLVLDDEELLLVLRGAGIGASQLLGDDDVGDGELVPHLQGSGSTGGCYPQTPGNVPSLGNKPRDASTTRLQVQLQVTKKGVAGFSPCFTLPAVQSPQRSSEKSWTPLQTKLSTQKGMMPHP